MSQQAEKHPIVTVVRAEWCSFCDTLTTDMVLHTLVHDLAEARTAVHTAVAHTEYGASLDALDADVTRLRAAIREHKKFLQSPPEESSPESVAEKGLSRVGEQGIVETGSVK